MNISGFEKFKEIIDEDAKRRDIRIYRFINIESLGLWIKVKNYLTQKCDNLIRLSDFCDGDDLNPNINRLCAKLKKTSKNSIILPLSEHLRINNTKNDEILTQIISLRYSNDAISGNIRVYIPLYRMRDILRKLAAQDNRLHNNFIFLENQFEDDDYSLTIISGDIDAGIDGNNINGYRRYLKYWEDNPAKPIVLYTDNARFYKENVFADNVRVLVNAYDIIKFHKLLPYDVTEEMGEDWQWRKLLESKISRSGFGIFSASPSAISMNEVIQLLSKWNDNHTDNFQKWFIWLKLKFVANSGYLNVIAKNSRNSSSFLSEIINGIFDCNYKDNTFKDYCQERKELIQNIGIEEFPATFERRLEEIGDFEKIFYLTDCTKKERELIINCFSRVMSDKEENAYMEFLKYAYPTLLAYIGNYSFENDLFYNYFRDYKIQKLKDNFSSEFLTHVSEIASQKGVWWQYSKPRNHFIKRSRNANTLLYWIDALGVEYLSLIQWLLESKFKGVFYDISIGFANIPTITEFNREFADDGECEAFRELDNLKHNGEYPECIEEELRIVECALKTAIQRLDSFERVIIVSDHGTSRGAVLNRGNSIKADSGAKVERFGRYCVQENVEYEKRFTGCIDRKNYHVFADYNRFSVSGNEKSEIHGGATLEEVLVPIIVLSKIPLEEKVVIIPLETEIKMKPGIKPRVTFKLDKDFETIFATIDGKRIQCHKTDDCFYFEPDAGKKENYTAKISGKGNIGELAYKLIKGSRESDKFRI